MQCRLVGGIFAVTITLAGCQGDLPTKVADVTSKLSANFSSVGQAAKKFAQSAEQVYANLDKYDLSPKGLDVKDGGIFDTFENNTYYYKTVAKGASYYASPMKPVDDTLRREIRILQQIEKPLEDAYVEDADTLAIAFYGVHQPTSIAMLIPWADVISFFPPNIDLRNLEWYQRGLKSHGEVRWAQKPFVSFYRGWVEDVAVPIFDKSDVRGVAVLAASLEKINTKYFAARTDDLVLLGPDLTPFAASPSARTDLPLQVAKDFDYTKQLKTNPPANDDYRLSAPQQPIGLQHVAAKIEAGQTSFEEEVEGHQYRFYVGTIKEPRFYVVGFVRE
jgi:hypothetical protein